MPVADICNIVEDCADGAGQINEKPQSFVSFSCQNNSLFIPKWSCEIGWSNGACCWQLTINCIHKNTSKKRALFSQSTYYFVFNEQNDERISYFLFFYPNDGNKHIILVIKLKLRLHARQQHVSWIKVAATIRNNSVFINGKCDE